MFLAELILVFCIFISIAYSSRQNVFISIYAFLSATIGFYISLIIIKFLINDDIQNNIQLFLIFYFLSIALTLLIKYSFLDFVRSSTIHFSKAYNGLKFSIAIALSFVIFCINLSFITQIDSGFVYNTSSKFCKYIIKLNIFGLFEHEKIKNNQQSISESDFIFNILTPTKM